MENKEKITKLFNRILQTKTEMRSRWDADKEDATIPGLRLDYFDLLRELHQEHDILLEDAILMGVDQAF